jgi:hypothetical protein
VLTLPANLSRMAASDKSAGAALVYSGGLELLGALSSIRTNSPQASAGDSQAGSSERSPRIAGKARSKAHSGAQPSLSQLSRSALRSPAGQVNDSTQSIGKGQQQLLQTVYHESPLMSAAAGTQWAGSIAAGANQPQWPPSQHSCRLIASSTCCCRPA